jgi:GxxExxY protein
MTDDSQLEQVAHEIIGAGLDVHRNLGPGLMESVYEICLTSEIQERGLRVERQKPLPVHYRGLRLDCSYRLDLLVEDLIIVEIKSVETILPLHKAQLLSYLRLSGYRLGLLINFDVPRLKDGIRRIIHGYSK